LAFNIILADNRNSGLWEPDDFHANRLHIASTVGLENFVLRFGASIDQPQIGQKQCASAENFILPGFSTK
jgi:hypothetical protein